MVGVAAYSMYEAIVFQQLVVKYVIDVAFYVVGYMRFAVFG